jgi:hypothetical protein
MTISPELALIAALADPLDGVLPAEPPLAPAQALDEAALLKLLRRNKVSLLPASRCGNPALRDILAREPFASYLAAEETSYAQARREYATIRAAFARAGIADVLIKSAGIAPSFPHLSDNVDDLVAPQHIPAARVALRHLGYVELRTLEEPRKFFFKRFAAGQQVAAHHLHEHVGWAVSFLDEPLVFQRARPAADDAALLIPHPNDAFLITTAHALYENKAFKLGDLVKVRHCLRTGELDWQHTRDLAGSKGWLDGLNIIITVFSRLDAAIYGSTLFPAAVVEQAEKALSSQHRAYSETICSGPLSMPLRVSFRFSKGLFYAKCLHDQRRSVTGKVYDIVRHTLNGTKLKLGIHSQPGMLVTLSGVDGCGKTRHAAALINALQLCDLRTSYVWSRSGSSRFTDSMVRLGKTVLRRPTTPAPTQEARASGRRAMLRSPLVRTVWSGLVTLDLLWQYCWRVRLPLLRGRVVVCDRYTYDAIADIVAVTGQRGSIFFRLLALLSPRPSSLSIPSSITSASYGDGEDGTDETYLPLPSHSTAAFLIAIPAATAVERRLGEISLDSAAAQTSLYRDLAQEHCLLVIDNTQSFAEANDQLVRTVIRSYFTRYHTVINGLLMANPDQSSR